MASEDTSVALLRHIADLKQHYSLQEFNPLGAGGVADFFTIAKDTIELASAVKTAIDLKIPYLVIGAGSTLLFSDGGFPGLVIQNKSHAIAFDSEKSQVVVDSGVPVNQLITAAANHGLGGLTHLYGETGTIGGAIYSNIGPSTRPIASSLRYLTLLLPPAKIDREATIVRYKGEWLQMEGQLTKLQVQKASKAYTDSQPVILTVLLQLTSVRTDEVRRRLSKQSHVQEHQTPRGKVMGPLFSPVLTQNVLQLLLESQPVSFKLGAVIYDKRHPNYLSCKGAVRSADIRQMIEHLQGSVLENSGIALICRYEYVVI